MFLIRWGFHTKAAHSRCGLTICTFQARHDGCWLSRIFYNVFHGFGAYGVDVNWPWHVQWKKDTVVLVWSSQLAKVRHYDKCRCGVWMGFHILEINMNLHFMGFGVWSLQLTHSWNLLMSHCLKEVLGWLPTVVLCELLLIVPTINRLSSTTEINQFILKQSNVSAFIPRPSSGIIQCHTVVLIEDYITLQRSMSSAKTLRYSLLRN